MTGVVDNQDFIFNKFKDLDFTDTKLQKLAVGTELEIYAVKRITTQFGEAFLMLDEPTKRVFISNKKETNKINKYFQYNKHMKSEYKYFNLIHNDKSKKNIYVRDDLQPFLNIIVLDTTFEYMGNVYKDIEYKFENENIVYDFKCDGQWVTNKEWHDRQDRSSWN